MYQYAEAGGLVDLTEFVTTVKDKIKPGLDPIYTYGGKYYGVPLEINVGNLLWYNKDMLAAKGIDPASISRLGRLRRGRRGVQAGRRRSDRLRRFEELAGQPHLQPSDPPAR